MLFERLSSEHVKTLKKHKSRATNLSFCINHEISDQNEKKPSRFKNQNGCAHGAEGEGLLDVFSFFMHVTCVSCNTHGLKRSIVTLQK